MGWSHQLRRERLYRMKFSAVGLRAAGWDISYGVNLGRDQKRRL